jgi:putative hydrolase of HD superfamily
MKPAKPDIHRLIDFHRLLLQFQAIERVIHVPDRDDLRLENDTEHSYNLVMMAWFLCDYFPHLDRDKVLRYALAHDLVEIHAGDTYIYADQKMLDSKVEREAKALKQLQEEWPDFPDMLVAIHAYENKTDAEAKFIYALDKIMPIFVIFIGKGLTWQQEGVTLDRLHAHKEPKVKLSPEIAPYYDELYALLLQNERYFPSDKAGQQR